MENFADAWIPSPYCYLVAFVIAANQLTGSIPSSIGNLSNLVYLSLRKSLFVGHCNVSALIFNPISYLCVQLNPNQVRWIWREASHFRLAIWATWKDSRWVSIVLKASFVAQIATDSFFFFPFVLRSDGNPSLSGSIPISLNSMTSLEELYLCKQQSSLWAVSPMFTQSLMRPSVQLWFFYFQSPDENDHTGPLPVLPSSLQLCRLCKWAPVTFLLFACKMWLMPTPWFYVDLSSPIMNRWKSIDGKYSTVDWKFEKPLSSVVM